MNEAPPNNEEVDARLASLAQFGFPKNAMAEFLAEHEGGTGERLEWLEQRRQTATLLDERFRRLESSGRVDDDLRDIHAKLNDPFEIEETVLEFERHVRNLVSWEPPLNRNKTVWFQAGSGKDWDDLFNRLMRLDASSLPAVVPLHRLFDAPERLDEIVRHLATIEADEDRQRQLVQAGAQRLKGHGYAVPDLGAFSLLEALQRLEQWQAFHATKEGVRLSAVQLIQPFDADLATEFEQRCHAIQGVEEVAAVNDLAEEIQALAQTLEQRRQTLSDAIQTWRGLGIVFPHEGDLHPKDLMAWEANHDTVAASVDRHLALVGRWKRFARCWPAQVAASENLLGHLDRTEELQDIVDEMDAMWKQLELDGLELLETYEHNGLEVGPWRQRVFDDPMNAMERMTVERERWDRRVELMNKLQALDTSFSGDEDVMLRIQLLANEDVGGDILDEMRSFVERTERRNERHRVMLNEELASLRRAGKLEREVQTQHMNLRDLEGHVADLTRTNGAADASTHNEAMVERMRASVVQEVESLHLQGWHVDEWRATVHDQLLRVARELSEARPHLLRHDVLRRRLAALPWNRDVALALTVEAMCRQPHRLGYLNQHVPIYTARLSSRAVEDENYTISLWKPVEKHPTLVPVPEDHERKVLQPATTLDDAHEAMLEAMDDGATDTSEALDSSVNQQAVGVENRSPIETKEPPVKVAERVSHSLEVETTSEAHSAPDAAFEEKAAHPRVAAPVEEQRTPPSTTSEVDGVQASTPPEITIIPPQRSEPTVSNPGKGTARTLTALMELVALLGLPEVAMAIEQHELEAMPDLRRRLAAEVNIAPRDVRIGRLLRLTLRLLPKGDEDDALRAGMLNTLCELVAPLKRWMRRRLEARHSGAGGEFLADAKALGAALDRIPGLGHHLPLELDDWPLPSDIDLLSEEVAKLARSVHLPSAGGVKA